MASSVNVAALLVAAAASAGLTGCDDSEGSCPECVADAGGTGGDGGGGASGDAGDVDCARRHLGPCIATRFSSSGVAAGPTEYVHELESGTVSPMLEPPPVTRYVRHYRGQLMVREELVVRDDVREVRSFEHDEDGRITMELRDEDADGEDEEGSLYRYDSQGRLEATACYAITDAADCSGESFAYRAWNGDGQPTERVSEDFPASVTTYEYDAACDLVLETEWSEQAGMRELVATIEYDYSCW